MLVNLFFRSLSYLWSFNMFVLNTITPDGATVIVAMLGVAAIVIGEHYETSIVTSNGVVKIDRKANCIYFFLKITCLHSLPLVSSKKCRRCHDRSSKAYYFTSRICFLFFIFDTIVTCCHVRFE
jgi:hypothetical protein